MKLQSNFASFGRMDVSMKMTPAQQRNYEKATKTFDQFVGALDRQGVNVNVAPAQQTGAFKLQLSTPAGMLGKAAESTSAANAFAKLSANAVDHFASVKK